MPFEVFRAALAMAVQKGEFIISGGEPLAAWDALKKMVAAIQRRYPKRYVSVQTNMTLMDDRRAAFMARRGINIEAGIDGDEQTVLANRPGSGVRYVDILRGLKSVRRTRKAFTATMTVHPSGVCRLEENVKLLASFGLRSVEVHPAFLEDWDKRSAKVFLEQYRRITAWEIRQGCIGVIGRGYSCPAGGAWDMVVLPDGRVLPSWVFLSFPEKVRERFYVMDLKGGFLRELPSGKRYFSALERFLGERDGMPSYRAVSNFNAGLAVRSSGGGRYSARVGAYTGLCESIEAVDRRFMGRIA